MSTRNSIRYLDKVIGICLFKITNWFSDRLFKTDPSIKECARCRDCGRTVHDFTVPDKLWIKVIGSPWGVWCYDCFCNRADERFGSLKWRMELVEIFKKVKD